MEKILFEELCRLIDTSCHSKKLPWLGFEPQTWKRGVCSGTGTATARCMAKEGKRLMIAYCFTECCNGCSWYSLLFPRPEVYNAIQFYFWWFVWPDKLLRYFTLIGLQKIPIISASRSLVKRGTIDVIQIEHKFLPRRTFHKKSALLTFFAWLFSFRVYFFLTLRVFLIDFRAMHLLIFNDLFLLTKPKRYKRVSPFFSIQTFF